MVDLTLDAARNEAEIRRQLRLQLRELNPDAIVRIRCGPKVRATMLNALSTRWLETILPPTMNLQFERSLFQKRSDDLA